MKGPLRPLMVFFMFTVAGLFVFPAAAGAARANLAAELQPERGPAFGDVLHTLAFGTHVVGAESSEKIKVEVSNAGTVASEKSKTTLVAIGLSGADAGSKIQLGGKSTKPVKPKRSRKLAFAFAGLSAGTYDLVACADAKKQVEEATETDNCTKKSKSGKALLAFVPAQWTGTVTGSGAPYSSAPGAVAKERSWSASVSFDSCGLPEVEPTCFVGLPPNFGGPEYYYGTGQVTITHDGCDGAPAVTVSSPGGLVLEAEPFQYRLNGRLAYARPDCTFSVTQSDGTVTTETIPGDTDTLTWVTGNPVKQLASWDPAALQLVGSCPSELFRDCGGSLSLGTDRIQVAWDLAGS